LLTAIKCGQKMLSILKPVQGDPYKLTGIRMLETAGYI